MTWLVIGKQNITGKMLSVIQPSALVNGKINVTQFLLCVYVPPAHCCNSLSPLQCIWVLRFPAGKSLDRELSSYFNTQPPDMCIKFSRPNACSINVCTVLCLYHFYSQSLPYTLHCSTRRKERDSAPCAIFNIYNLLVHSGTFGLLKFRLHKIKVSLHYTRPFLAP